MYVSFRYSPALASGRVSSDVFVGIAPTVKLLLFVLAVTASCWSRQSMSQAYFNKPLAYEVASIRPSAPDVSGAGMTNIVGNRFVTKNLSVQQMVSMAYDIDTDDLISNLPKWANSARFDVQARLEDEKVPQGEIQRTQVILRALLADRFGMQSHYEKLARRGYMLVTDKNGPKVQKAAATDDFEMNVGPGNIHLRNSTMTYFIQGISLTVGRPVIDKTGLTGHYNIDFKCVLDQLADTNEAGASVYTVLREQFGLRLVPTKNPVDVLVIDRLEMPLAN